MDDGPERPWPADQAPRVALSCRDPCARDLPRAPPTAVSSPCRDRFPTARGRSVCLDRVRQRPLFSRTLSLERFEIEYGGGQSAPAGGQRYTANLVLVDAAGVVVNHARIAHSAGAGITLEGEAPEIGQDVIYEDIAGDDVRLR